MTRRVGRLAPALILALCQVSLLAQSTCASERRLHVMGG